MQNFAMMGIATGPNHGMLTVTDDDTVEKSNLSRQFLFRDWNIGRCVTCWGVLAFEVTIRVAQLLNAVHENELQSSGGGQCRGWASLQQ